MTKHEVLAEILRRGATRAEVHFSGGNDEGGVDSIELVRLEEDGTAVTQSEIEPGWQTGMRLNQKTWDYEQDPEATAEETFIGALQEPVYATYHSFAGEFYVDGTVIWDAQAGTVKMTGSEENMVAEPINQEF